MISSGLGVRPRSGVRVAEYPPSATFGPRRLGDYEFVWVLTGSARWQVEEADPDTGRLHRFDHALRPGTLALARAGTVESYVWDSQQTSTHAYVHFQADTPTGQALLSRTPMTRSMSAHEPLGALCSYLLALEALDAEAARARSNQVVGLMVDLFVTGPFPEPSVGLQPSEQLGLAVEFVRITWGAGGMRIIHLDELAAASHVSTAHFSRVFRREVGCAPSTALELIRLGRAAISLQRSNATLREVAELAGFSNPYHFSKRFSLAYGVPPGEFRRGAEASDPLWPVERAGLLPLWRSLTGRA